MTYWDKAGRQCGDDQKGIPETCQKYHPDSNAGNPQAEQMFKDVNEAYSILVKSERRNSTIALVTAAFDEQRRIQRSWRCQRFWKWFMSFGSGFGGTGQGGSWHYQEAVRAVVQNTILPG